MEYEVIRSNRKTMRIEINRGKLIVRVPMGATEKEIKALLDKYKGWIETHLAKAEER